MDDHYAGHPAVPAEEGVVGALPFTHDDHGISPEPSSAGGTAGGPLTGARYGSGGDDPLSAGKSARQSGLLICQVENCCAPLDGLKEYHQRYKVCERHLKLNYIERGVQKLRFCQQCGRFQPLDEFDDSKRSCRVRLQRHNARRRKRPREAGGGASSGGGGMAVGAGSHGEGAGGNGVSIDDVEVMQEALHFASATLMQTTAQNNRLVSTPGHGGAPHTDGEEDAVLSAAAGIAGLPFGAQLSSMPFVPSPAVMILLLKGYAGMFHYSIEKLHLKPRAEPSSLQALSGPMDAAAAAAAAMAVNGPLAGGMGAGVGAMEGAAAAAGVTDAEGAAAAQQIMAAFQANSHEYSAAAAAAVAAATGGLGVFAGGAGPGDVFGGAVAYGDGAAPPDAAAVEAAAAVVAVGQQQMQQHQQHQQEQVQKELAKLAKEEEEEMSD